MSGLKVVKDDTKKILKATKALVRSRVLVGIPEGADARDDGKLGNAAIGYLNETGSPAQNIPARPHLIPGVEDAKDAIAKQLFRAGKAALDGDKPGVKAGLTGAGVAGATAVGRRIDSNIPPPLSEKTLALRKKSGRSGTIPLIDEGEYRRSIAYVVKGGLSMPLLDVSEVLDDPDFVDTVTVKRTVVAVNAFGRSTPTTTTQQVQAVVTSADGDNLLREPDGRMAVGGITIHTRFALTSGDDDTDADIIIWHGKEYTVDIVNDYTGFGQGFVSASALIRSVT